jgi:hypothetical protein
MELNTSGATSVRCMKIHKSFRASYRKGMARNMENKIISNIGYVWLCNITKSLKDKGQISKEQEQKINLLNAQILSADIIIT